MSRLARLGFAVLGLLPCAACTPADPFAEDPVLAWRRRLADPAAFAIRTGMKLDEATFRSAALQARDEFGERLTKRWETEVRALPEMRPPTAPEYRSVLEVKIPDEPLARSSELVMQLGDRGLQGTLRRSLSMYLPIAMTRDLGMSTAEMGRWLAFLGLAEPASMRCGTDALCMSYGGLDVFVFSTGRHDGSPLVERVQWWQRTAP